MSHWTRYILDKILSCSGDASSIPLLTFVYGQTVVRLHRSSDSEAIARCSRLQKMALCKYLRVGTLLNLGLWWFITSSWTSTSQILTSGHSWILFQMRISKRFVKNLKPFMALTVHNSNVWIVLSATRVCGMSFGTSARYCKGLWGKGWLYKHL